MAGVRLIPDISIAQLLPVPVGARPHRVLACLLLTTVATTTTPTFLLKGALAPATQR